MKKLNKRNGFTLIEVVLAMTIMASGLFILTNSWSGTYSRLKKTQIQVQLASLLERKVVEIEREFKNKPLDTFPEEKEEAFEGVENYSWKIKTQKLELPDLSAVLESQQEGTSTDLSSFMKLFSEHISKTVREVKIEVIYTGSKKPISADVVIYFIDYDKTLPLPGGAS
jgi:general secretion pathway protein I